MAGFSGLERNRLLNEMQGEQYDLLIIGGGITGAGIALDAATRGLKTALVEMHDFASGTSSRSTKLVHGGLRYLKQFEIKEVADLGKERAIVYENGPHVTTPEWMLLPFHKGGTFGRLSTSFGLRMYDFLAGVKKSERRRMLSREETIAKVPFVKKGGLLGSGLYVEYRTDDARLTIEVMKTAFEKGAIAVNYAKVDSFVYDEQNQLSGAEVIDRITGNRMVIRAKKVVNAAGPWVDELREADGSKNGKHLQLSKGVHIVFDQSIFPLQQAVYFDTEDGRMVFAIPRSGKTYVGTTDTFYDGDPAKVHASKEDKEYILRAIRYMFPELTVQEKDIESSWAGVRPLIYEEGKDPSEISRKDEIWVSEKGLITIAGGKLTGYRKMAETVVDLVVKQLGETGDGEAGISVTKNLPISGGDIGGSKNLDSFLQAKIKEAENLGISKEEGRMLANVYGTNVNKVFSFLPEGDVSLPKGLYAQLQYAIYHEMAMSPVDFFFRRTGDLLFNICIVKAWKKEVVNKMSIIYQWSEEKRNQYEKELEKEIDLASSSLKK
ncbi:glycerol-3-phosphate dehydrogenase/oxidase [Bacillus sp. FJAT-50079]|uniref:glycerol-3-phosphate dehydrogenase/oxidase n=1 Tax=Bacillus sp. FJAT-50079 TaxID=2833577 RepID=UPI001BC8F0DC|nr:glycerol-3-phosphate dehydrogenase/oxidase [Bacillus sp. FJAT-50079]MBS4210281.1 glycerol-3-phosphate dehydrogenase/oxidase [Bacillus sp. FJAT-50079]